MVESAQVSGFTSDETVRCSQELDRLIYEYQCLCKEKELQRVRTKVIFRQMLLLAKKQYILSHA
ncbi:aspartyl-phosphate phosphatase Spo0E family protein [Mesobacillus subterraneus]|uniref:Aspartyl-phosphate phosphatase Spo0E family protein n=2 Tax=Mesobacillus subterraneus TaxID=285983 RepID=A0A427TV51_9BACI|nr:aspartyl-phosphate phosphatase Spo0E family protein [Mesobacillus subterraneus]